MPNGKAYPDNSLRTHAQKHWLQVSKMLGHTKFRNISSIAHQPTTITGLLQKTTFNSCVAARNRSWRTPVERESPFPGNTTVLQ